MFKDLQSGNVQIQNRNVFAEEDDAMDEVELSNVLLVRVRVLSPTAHPVVTCEAPPLGLHTTEVYAGGHYRAVDLLQVRYVGAIFWNFLWV